ncbi:MAG: carboxypeptidase regulatory-like domain-containing protein [Planctomycetota bacterium]|jgi:protocatechuate 3,4-dioxygenase beta subunit
MRRTLLFPAVLVLVAMPTFGASDSPEANAPPTQQVAPSDGLVEISVFDAKSQAAIPNAAISIDSDEFSEEVATDARGQTVVPLAEGKYRVSARTESGYCFGKDVEMHVEAGKATSLFLPLEPLITVTGIVTDADGNPVEGADVHLGPWVHTWGHQILTDKEGRFEAEYPPPGYYEPSDDKVNVIAFYNMFDFIGTARIDDVKETIKVRVVPSVAVTGRVLGPDGKPITDVQVIVGLWTLERHWLDRIRMLHECAGEDGAFKIDRLTDESAYEFYVDADGYCGLTKNIFCEARDGVFDVGTVTLQLARMSVSGAVVDGSGKPLAGVTVFAAATSPDVSSGGQTMTDAQGRFQIDKLAEGEMHLTICDDNGTALGCTICTAGDEDVTCVVGKFHEKAEEDGLSQDE